MRSIPSEPGAGFLVSDRQVVFYNTRLLVHHRPLPTAVSWVRLTTKLMNRGTEW